MDCKRNQIVLKCTHSENPLTTRASGFRVYLLSKGMRVKCDILLPGCVLLYEGGDSCLSTILILVYKRNMSKICFNNKRKRNFLKKTLRN